MPEETLYKHFVRLVVENREVSSTNPFPVTFSGPVTISGVVDVMPAVPVPEDYLPVRITDGTSFEPTVTVSDGGSSITVDGSVSLAAAVPTGDNTIGRVKITDGSAVADIRDLVNSNAVNVAIVDSSGDQITSFGGGVQYTEGDTDATITGTAIMWEDAGDTLRPVSAAKPLPVSDAGTSLTVDGSVSLAASLPAGDNTIGRVKITDGTTVATVRELGTNDALNVAICDASGNQITTFGSAPSVASTANSSTSTLTANSTFTGTSESVLAYAAVSINLKASHDAAADGVSIEWSNDGSNWDRTEKWDYKANANFSVCLRPKGEFFRLQYTNGGTNQTSFRLKTIFHPVAPRMENFIENGRVIVDGFSYKVKWKAIDATSSGDTTVIAGVTNKKLRILTIWHTGSDQVVATYKSGSNILIDGSTFAKSGGPGLNMQDAAFFLETNAGEAFIINLNVTKNVRGAVTYIELPAA